MKYICHYDSPLGGITMASDKEAITGLWFDDQKYFGAGLEPDALEKSLPIFDRTRLWLDTYFSGQVPDFTPKLVIESTPFRKSVLQILLTIPYGETMTYAQIADLLAARRGISSLAPQAVGQAVGKNPISLIIPCHRVIGSDGSLTGYAGGLDRKRKLLAMEQPDRSVSP